MLQGDPLSTQQLAALPSGLSNINTTREVEGPVSTGTENRETRSRENTHRVKSTSNRLYHGNQVTSFHSNGHQHPNASRGRRNDYQRPSSNASNRPGIQHLGMITPGRHDYQQSHPGQSEQFPTQSYLASYSPANFLNVRKHSAGAGASMPVSEHQDAPGAMVAHLNYHGQSLPRSTLSESWRHSKSGESSHSNGPQISGSSSLESTTGYKSNHHIRTGNTSVDSAYYSRKPLSSHRSKSQYPPSSYTPIAPTMQEYAVSWGHTMHRVMPPTVYYSMQSYPTFLHTYESRGNIGAIHSSPGTYSPPMSSHSPTSVSVDSSAGPDAGLPPTTGDIGSFGGQAPAMNRLQGQLEWYFSPQNLATDAYLASKMDKDKWVSISIIADFKKVKAMTNRMEDVVEALQRSTVVEVDGDGTKVRPILTNRPRTTLIIRELPDDTERQEIGAVFEEAECPAKSITKEVIGNLWFVEFETADQALRMLYHTRGRYLRSVPIAARLKSTILHTSRESYKSSLSQCSLASPAVRTSCTLAPFGPSLITIPVASPTTMDTSEGTPEFVPTPTEIPASDHSSTTEYSPPRSWSSESESIYDEPMHRMSMPYRRFPIEEETSSQDIRSSHYSQVLVAQGPHNTTGAGRAFSRPVHPAPSTSLGYMSYMVAENQYSLPIATSDMPGYDAIASLQGQIAGNHSDLGRMTTRTAHTPLAWVGYNGQVWLPAHDASATHSCQYQPAVLDESRNRISQNISESWRHFELHELLQGDVQGGDYANSGQSSHQLGVQAPGLRQNSLTSSRQRVRQGEESDVHSGISFSNTPAAETNDKSRRRAPKKNTRPSHQTLNQERPSQLSQRQRQSHLAPQKQYPQQYQPQESLPELSSDVPRSRENTSLVANSDPEQSSHIHGLPPSVNKTGIEASEQISKEKITRDTSNAKSGARLSKPIGLENRVQSASRRNGEKGTKSKANAFPPTTSRHATPFKNESFPPLPTATSSTPVLKNTGAEGATSNISWGPSKQVPTVDPLGVEYPTEVKSEASDSPPIPLRDSKSGLPALKIAVQRQSIQDKRLQSQRHQNQTGTQIDTGLAGLSRVEMASRESCHGPEILEKTAFLYKMNVTPTPPMFSYASVLKAQQREAVVERLHVPEVQGNNQPSQCPTVDASASEAL